MASKRTIFNELWLDSKQSPEFVGWLCKGPDSFHPYCRACKKSFELGNMGRQAVISHAKGKKHMNLTKCVNSQTSVKNFFCSREVNISSSSNVENTDTSAGSKTTDISEECTKLDNSDPQSSTLEKTVSIPACSVSVDSLCLKDDVLRAEVLWALKVVNTQTMPLNSTADLGETFRSMFPDSGIASKFSMGATKCSYFINHGLAPYFDQLLKERLSECKDYVVCFDESVNKIVQRGQIDLLVRYFDVNRNKACTQYYNSVFLGHASAENLLHSFTSGIQPMSLNKILSISMDGPNVNLSFIKKLDEKIKEESEPDGKILVNTGVCGLHVVNGAIRTGLNSVGWEVQSFLRDIYFIFNESPARHAEFTSVTDRKVFPRKYCTTRWLENVPCLERALLLFDDIKKFIEKRKAVKTNTFLNVTAQSKDKFMKCKLSFFKSLSTDCEPFLKKYQTASPLAPYLFSDLKNLIETLMQRFVKSSKMPATVKKLLAVDLHCAENLRELKNIDLGFQTKKLLREVVSTDREVLEFKKDCQKILTQMTEKILERSPLKYPAVQGLSSLDPKIIHKQPDQGKIRFNILLDALYSHNRITETVAQRAKTQYSVICGEAQSGLQKKFCEFLEENSVESSQFLDEFYSSILHCNIKYQDLWEVVKLCLIFSHGNATVESGFSINKSLLAENLHEESLIAQRQVYDGIKYYETIHKVPVTQKMLSYVRNSRRRYGEHLDNARQNRKEEDGTIQKRQLQNEIKKLEERRKILRLEKQHEEEIISAQINLLHKKVLD